MLYVLCASPLHIPAAIQLDSSPNVHYERSFFYDSYCYRGCAISSGDLYCCDASNSYVYSSSLLFLLYM